MFDDEENVSIYIEQLSQPFIVCSSRWGKSKSNCFLLVTCPTYFISIQIVYLFFISHHNINLLEIQIFSNTSPIFLLHPKIVKYIWIYFLIKNIFHFHYYYCNKYNLNNFIFFSFKIILLYIISFFSNNIYCNFIRASDFKQVTEFISFSIKYTTVFFS